jgi:DsbC/DsbD-like thiol-disulfide interchange protein
MKKVILFFAAVLFAAISFAQIKDPVKWSTSSKKVGDGYQVVLTATLPKPWHIYSQTTGEGGPVATTFKFTKSPIITFNGNVKEIGKLKEEYDKNFDTKVKYYSDKVDFVQAVKLKSKVKTNVNVTVEYMTCDDSQCLPPTKKTFNVSL